MSTTSTAPAVIDALVAAVNADLTDVTCWAEWPGPEVTREMVILGDIAWSEYEIPTIKTARKQRTEAYEVEFQVVVVGGTGSTPSDITPSRDRAFEILESLENVLAEDPTSGTDYQTIQWAQLRPTEAGAREFEHGWGYRIAGTVAVQARLQ